MKQRASNSSQKLTLVAVTLGACLLVACSSKGAKQMRVLRNGKKFTETYLTGDATTARRSLEEQIQFYQTPAADILEPSGHAGILYCSYARLYTLESRTGDRAGADAALGKARFWSERRYELAGETNAASMEECRLFSTPQKLTEVADKLDSVATNGKGPRYTRGLQIR